ncbi:MAG: hypothetical protein ACFE0J_00825 [Elainellaceae cyanobacterium]
MLMRSLNMRLQRRYYQCDRSTCDYSDDITNAIARHAITAAILPMRSLNMLMRWVNMPLQGRYYQCDRPTCDCSSSRGRKFHTH